MSEKRRDHKGRILRTGESQRKDGRYLYKYVDSFGETQFIYSWKLVATDRVLAGKRDCIALREKIAEIQKDVQGGIDVIGKKMTLCQLYAKQNAVRPNVKANTKSGRKYLMEILKDDYVRKNPFDFQLNTVIDDDTIPKTVLTSEQEARLLDFAKSDTVYHKNYDEILILLKTGLRISELCGLTVSDLDFENHLISVDHQLLRNTELGYYIETPKTKSSERQIPMVEATCQALKRTLAKRDDRKCVEIDGYSHFLFLNRKGYPKTSGDFDSILRNFIKKYNKYHEEKLPHITPHTLRHTFCTNCANAGMNPKALQYIMGHANITMTLNYYAHATYNSAMDEMKRLEKEQQSRHLVS
ncbi:tyrosine-type recombinase/integrase [Streptococcus mutans]|uniref:tyrosine-type recombinase/integrase n=1 Tax=Streptococcus mutans TaxID=1309 RepID=UPI0038BDA3FB